MWYGWPIARVLLLFTGIAFLMISMQVTIFHYRQNFRHWAMYGPVLAGPVLGVLTVGLAFYNNSSLRGLVLVLLYAGAVIGVLLRPDHPGGGSAAV